MTTLAASGAVPAVALRVEVISTFDALLQIESQWTALMERSGLDHPFLTHEWVRTWWTCFGRGRQLHVVVVRDETESIEAIVPLMWSDSRMYGLRIRRLESIGNVHSPRFDFAIGRATEDVFRAVWKHLAHETLGWDVMQFSELPAGSHPLLELPEYAREQGLLTGCWRSVESPYVPIAGTWDRYLQTLNAKHRSNLRNRFKRLATIGPIAFERFESIELLDEALALEAAAWKGEAGTAIVSSADVRRFYRALAERAAARGWLRLCFLNVGGRRIAFHYVIQYRGKQYLLKPGYDPAFSAYSPSNLLCALSLEDAFARGLTEYDFLGDAEQWKLQWATCTRPHEWLFVFSNTLRGRLLYKLKFQLLPRFHQKPLYRFIRAAALTLGLHA